MGKTMSRFDEEPDGDLHGECVNEIRSQAARIKELEADLLEWKVAHSAVTAERDALKAVLVAVMNIPNMSDAQLAELKAIMKGDKT